MPDQINIGNFAKGLKLDRLPFNIDNDAFNTMFNTYSWRGRAKRKRGTIFLGRLERQIESVITPINNWQFGPLTLVAGIGNLITGPWTQGIGLTPITLEVTANLVPGSIDVVVAGDTYTDPNSDGILFTGGIAAGFINYTSGLITITAGGTDLIGTFSYYPTLPVLGIEDFVSNSSSAEFPLTIVFDDTYAYQINQVAMPFFYSVSYYKNTNNPVVWSNTDDNQFWSTNYQSAFWVTNNKPGFHFKQLTNNMVGNSVQAASATEVNFSLANHGLIAGDYIFINEVTGALGTAAGNANINNMTGMVIAAGLVANGFNAIFTGINGTSLGNFTVGATGQNGIAQYLTNSIPGQDGIRWYDGDPTNKTGLPTGTGLGWVNFSPPLTATSVSINDQLPGLYYLVGALAIYPFKDRLLFFGPQIQTSIGNVIQRPLQDTVLWSWNGTPYYNALVPTNAAGTETYDVRAYYVDQTGFGGYLPAGVSQPIGTVIPNEDVILIGFGGSGKKTRFVYTNNDLQPFLFYAINSQYPSNSTFSGIPFDQGGVEVGDYGITMTTQQSSDRIDLEIPDSVFEIQALNNGQNRVNAIRDFYREWVYFSYPTEDGKASNGSWIYPSQSFLWNYRDNTWAIQRENYTHHGTFRRIIQYTWATLPFKTWAQWREPWNAGLSQAQFPSIAAGNPQGFILIKGEGTGEAPSGYIANISDDGMGHTQITSYNHCVNSGDTGSQGLGDYLSFGGTSIGLVISTIDQNNFVVDIPFPSVANITNITNATQAVVSLMWPIAATPPIINSYFVGQTVSIAGVTGMTELNGNTYTILAVTPTTITLNVNSTGFTPYISGGTTTLVSYIGLATYSRLSQPLLQTKQFPLYWAQGRQIRLGAQKYLLDRTANGQATINIYLSQDPDTVWNDPTLPNSSLEYSQLLYTCPESTNLGLTASNTNLQMPTAATQFQIWHRINTSLIGDTVQVGLTLSDLQMRNLEYATSEIALHGMQLNVAEGPLLA